MVPCDDRINSHDQFSQGGFAAAVGSGDRVKFALFESEIHAVDNIAPRAADPVTLLAP